MRPSRTSSTALSTTPGAASVAVRILAAISARPGPPRSPAAGAALESTPPPRAARPASVRLSAIPMRLEAARAVHGVIGDSALDVDPVDRGARVGGIAAQD